MWGAACTACGQARGTGVWPDTKVPTGGGAGNGRARTAHGPPAPDRARTAPTEPLSAPSPPRGRYLLRVDFLRTVPRPDRRARYHTRLLVGYAASFALVTAAFVLWPDRPPPDPGRAFAAEPPETVALELLPQTVQRPVRVPPPPPPSLLPPIEVEDAEIPEEALDLPSLEVRVPTAIALPAPPGPAAPAPGPPAFVAEAQQQPTPLRFVEPDYPEAARRKNVRARVRVRVLVDERGRVQETAIVERLLVDRKDREEAVSSIGYGVEEAAQAAAARWHFRPGRHEGRKVRTYTTITLAVGV